MAMTRTPGTRRRQALPTDVQVGNSILAALLATEYKHLSPKLEHVTLKRGEIVYRADQEIQEVYFPEQAARGQAQERCPVRFALPSLRSVLTMHSYRCANSGAKRSAVCQRDVRAA
jgi:hypothetical protein